MRVVAPPPKAVAPPPDPRAVERAVLRSVILAVPSGTMDAACRRRVDDALAGIVHRCPCCGRARTAAEWCTLPYPRGCTGPVAVDPDVSAPEVHDMRNCDCGSTVVVVLDEGTHA